MSTPRTLIAAALALSASGAALADPYYDYGPYSGGAAYAQVLSATPVYRPVQIAEPRQECYQQPVVYDRGYRGGSFAGSLIGGLVGGVVGHQFGSGGGRVLATAAGAVIGANVGAGIGARNDYESGQVGYREECRTVADYRTEQRADGYDVTYRYGGRIYRTHLPYDPGPGLRVNVNVAPAGY
jgi:uncharacterized protein YcfJ